MCCFVSINNGTDKDTKGGVCIVQRSRGRSYCGAGVSVANWGKATLVHRNLEGNFMVNVSAPLGGTGALEAHEMLLHCCQCTIWCLMLWTMGDLAKRCVYFLLSSIGIMQCAAHRR